MDLKYVVDRLSEGYGPRGWWPLPSRGGDPGRNEGGYLEGTSRPIGPGGGQDEASARFEIAAGAVLAQNTAWRGASLAVAALGRSACLSAEGVLSVDEDELAELLRPAGTYRRKARYLRALALAWPDIEAGVRDRDAMLGIEGIGYETADCILAYGYGEARFVADAYARRIMSRLGFIPAGSGYEPTRLYAEAALPADAPYLAEAHALLVEHAKRSCRAKPACGSCLLGDHCLVSRSMVTGPMLT